LSSNQSASDELKPIHETVDVSSQDVTRVIRPSDRGALLDQRFQLEDISELTEALVRNSQGRIEHLRGAAYEFEERLRAQVERSRQQITEAMRAARKQIEDRVNETTRRSQEAVDRAYQEGRERGEREGFEQASNEGFQKGYSEGLEKGLLEGRSKAYDEVMSELSESTGGLVPALESLVQEFDQERRQLRDCAHRDLLELAVTMARRIVRREVESPEGVIRDVLRAAIDRIENQHGLKIEIHPKDRLAAEEYLSEIYGKVSAQDSIEIVEKTDLERGGCIVRAVCGTVDQSIETQFSLIEERLLGSHSSQSGSSAFSTEEEFAGEPEVTG